MEPFCGSVQANARRALYNLEETRASSNGQRTSVKKRKEKAKTTSCVYGNLFPTIFSHKVKDRNRILALAAAPVKNASIMNYCKECIFFSLTLVEMGMSNLDMCQPPNERIY
jgi:hypothetical protein